MSAGVRDTRDVVLAAELLAGSALQLAAERAGVSERTARRRLGDEAFRSMLDEGRAEIMAAVVARLAGAADRAVATLLELLEQPTPDAVRRNAARDVLGYVAELGEASDLGKRLAALEELLEARVGRVA